MTDPYSVLGITPGADDETIKKAYRQKCKQYHPDLHPNDPTAEEHFKEVQAAYGSSQGGCSQQGYGQQSGYNQQYGNPFGGAGGFGFGPFGFGYYSTSGGARQTYTTGQESPELRAAANYIRSGFYEEALNTLNGITQSDRTAQWHYYAALANQGLGNNIRARDEARAAVNMEPNNYAYQNLLDQLQNPGQPYAQPSGNPGRFCLSFWVYMMFCQLLSCCCTGRPGGFFFC